MSRRVILLAITFLVQPQIATAQTMNADDVAALIEKNRRLYELDEQGCPKFQEDDAIVVCGSSHVGEEYRLGHKDNDEDEDRIHRGEAVSTKRAAACVAGVSDCPVRLPAAVGMGFGYVPPYPPLLEDVMKGLPDQENIVLEGSVDSGGRPIVANPDPNSNPSPSPSP